LKNEVKNPMKRWVTLVFILSIMLFVGACKKKVAPPPPPPPPAAPAPTASLSANPNSVDKGQATTLTWQTTNATDVSIDGIGPVETSGSRSVTPADSTTYRLTEHFTAGGMSRWAPYLAELQPEWHSYDALMSPELLT